MLRRCLTLGAGGGGFASDSSSSYFYGGMAMDSARPKSEHLLTEVGRIHRRMRRPWSSPGQEDEEELTHQGGDGRVLEQGERSVPNLFSPGELGTNHSNYGAFEELLKFPYVEMALKDIPSLKNVLRTLWGCFLRVRLCFINCSLLCN